MKNTEETTLVEVPNTAEPTQHDLGFAQGYEDFKSDKMPLYTLIAGLVVQRTTTQGTIRATINDFARGYIAGFVRAHEETYG